MGLQTARMRLMEVLLAEEFGFCFGVERAVEMVEEAVAEGGVVRSLGPLIHNSQEMKRLEAQGVQFLAETIDSGVCHMAVFSDPDGNVLMLHNRYAPKD